MSKFNLLVTGLLVGGSLLAIVPAGIAQINNSSDNRDPFSRASQGDTTGLLQLLHGLQNGRRISDGDFAKQQQEQLADSTADFRAQQLRRLREQQQSPKKP